jgi:hypothetical protein
MAPLLEPAWLVDQAVVVARLCKGSPCRCRHNRGEGRASPPGAGPECWIMVIKLQRLTTEYIVIEDRMRISGETRDAGPVVMWLTNRLATRAVPRFLGWLEDQAAPTVGSSSAFPVVKHELQSFAQAAAVARLKQQKPVIAQADAPSWIVQAIDITPTQGGLSITFRGEQDQSAGVRFDAMGLRQWLSILHRAWLKAQRPALVWPDWIKREEPAPQDVVRH